MELVLSKMPSFEMIEGLLRTSEPDVYNSSFSSSSSGTSSEMSE